MQVRITNYKTREHMFWAEVGFVVGNSVELAVEWAIKNSVSLKGADLSGALFSGVDLRNVDFTDCYLAFSGFADCNLSNANFTNADLHETTIECCNVHQTNFAGAKMTNCDFSGTHLGKAIIPKTPVIDDLDGKILSRIADGGSLDMNEWHTCKTTHCRAGWAIVLAKTKGRALEKKHGSRVAGSLIYAAAYPDLPVPDFASSNMEAMDDLQERAALAS